MHTSRMTTSAVQAPSTQPQGAEQAVSVPTNEEIRHRAYEIYLEGGAISGGELDDWLRAERELNKIALYNRSRRRVSTLSE